MYSIEILIHINSQKDFMIIPLFIAYQQFDSNRKYSHRKMFLVKTECSWFSFQSERNWKRSSKHLIKIKKIIQIPLHGNNCGHQRSFWQNSKVSHESAILFFLSTKVNRENGLTLRFKNLILYIIQSGRNLHYNGKWSTEIDMKRNLRQPLWIK